MMDGVRLGIEEEILALVEQVQCFVDCVHRSRDLLCAERRCLLHLHMKSEIPHHELRPFNGQLLLVQCIRWMWIRGRIPMAGVA